MKLADAQALARALMDDHGLTEWNFRFDRAKRRAGSCTYATRTITLSRALTQLYDEADVRGVILHEIAHALVGPSHRHDAVWKAQARALGVSDRARLPGHLPQPERPWVGTCPVCGAQRHLYSAPRTVTSCASCSRTFDPTRIFRWERDGVPASPGVAYERQLRRLRRFHRTPRA